jgi:hypothetical protein
MCAGMRLARAHSGGECQMVSSTGPLNARQVHARRTRSARSAQDSLTMADNISGAENTRCMVGRGWAMGREGIGLRHHFVRGNITSPRLFFVCFLSGPGRRPGRLEMQAEYILHANARTSLRGRDASRDMGGLYTGLSRDGDAANLGDMRAKTRPKTKGPRRPG